jgi:DNA-binding Xre family transcriptional regulator
MSDQKFLEVLGQVMRAKRGDITKRSLHKELGVPESSIDRLEKGKINTGILTLRRLCGGLGVEVADVLREVELTVFHDSINQDPTPKA